MNSAVTSSSWLMAMLKSIAFIDKSKNKSGHMTTCWTIAALSVSYNTEVE